MIMAARPLRGEREAARALELARGLAAAEAARLGISRSAIDPEDVAGLAALQWLRSAGMRREGLSGLRLIVRRRLLNDFRSAVGRIGSPRAREKMVSLEALGNADIDRVFAVAEPERPAENLLAGRRVRELLALDLTGQERTFCRLMIRLGTRRAVWKRMGVCESRACQLVQSIRLKAREAGLT